MKTKKGFTLVLSSVMALTMLAACGKSTTGGSGAASPSPSSSGSASPSASSSPSQAPEMTKDPITLTFMAPWDDGMVQRRIGSAVKEKWPNITIKTIVAFVEADKIQETLAKKEVPDFLLATDGFETLKEYDMMFPLDDLMKKYKFDESKLMKGTVDAIRARDPEGKGRMLGIPFEDTAFALHYNKDIFDKFGVPYPKDGITWEEALDLAKKVTGERDGVKYRGLATNGLWQALTELSPQGTDPKTGEPKFSKEPAFEKYLSFYKQVTEIPGNYAKDVTYDFKKGDVAMFINNIANTIQYFEDPNLKLNYDVVGVPVWKDAPTKGPSNMALTIAINKHSKYKEEAFQIMQFLMSEEQQMKLSRSHGVSSVLDNQAIHDAYAADALKGKQKNIKSIYALKPAPPAPYSSFGPDMLSYGSNYVATQAKPFVDSGDDVRTFLRKMDEDYAKLVKEKQMKK
ncbi:ABC transporter substrate-binding protein [Paenibacillus sp. MBLB4367]|uniref:ABC transporter substrate-binding protein n=1 Tax=Paenibacillus sp. MBLB4367 TaxID=3384767 RepID=UPI003907FC2E